MTERLEENGWIPRDDDPNLDGKEYSKMSRKDGYLSLVIMHHSSHRNYGISFKHVIVKMLKFTDEEYEIHQEQERGIYRINTRMRNKENGRIALFTRSIHKRCVFDGDCYKGNYEDNGEEVTYSIPWSFRNWEVVDVEARR